MKALILGTALLLAATGAALADGIEIGTPGYGGPGCAGGTATIIASPAGTSFGMVFDGYLMEAGGGGKGLDRKACAVAVPVKVPAGMSIALQAVALRGHASLPDGAEAVVSIEPFFAGSQGPKQETTLKGPTDEPFSVVVLPAAEAVWSPCGADVNLRVNTSVRLTAKGEKAWVNVYGMTLYRVETKAC